MSETIDYGTKNQRSHELTETPILIATLGVDKGAERESARRALVNIGEPAVPALIDALSNLKQQVRWEAAKALGQIGDPIAAPALVTALEDKHFGVRWLAAVGLVALKHDGVQPLLSALLERSDSDCLREGAHHVCHNLSKGESCEVVKPVLAALNKPEPQLAVPLAAYAALNSLRASLSHESDEEQRRRELGPTTAP